MDGRDDRGGQMSFETEWPDLSRKLQARLSRRGLSSWVIDDIVQETGLRLFRKWDDVDPNRSVWGLALTIANNLLWESMRRKSASEVIGEVPEHAADLDVERSSFARMRLAVVVVQFILRIE